MADWNWATGRLTRVLHPTGKFTNGEKRYRRAQFDFLNWDISGSDEGYILVPPADRQVASQEAIASAPQEHEAGTEYGFYRDETFVVEENGHYDENSMPYLHAFGHI